VSKKSAADFLRDMLIELDDIAAFSEGGIEASMRDTKTRKAIIRSYEVVGEIAKRLPAAIREANPQIDWRQLIGFRDFLAHHYEGVIFQNIVNAIEDLPRLRAILEALLASLPDELSNDNND
jgi:uncharacterized protein with HEPN domain